MTKNKVYFEKVKEKIGNIVTSSEVTEATPSQIQEFIRKLECISDNIVEVKSLNFPPMKLIYKNTKISI